MSLLNVIGNIHIVKIINYKSQYLYVPYKSVTEFYHLFLVNRAQIAEVNTGVSTAATQQYYVVCKLQNVKSTTFTAKGPQPCWNQEFLL